MSHIIGLVGYSNSGKGTYCYFVRRVFGIPSLTTGDIVRAEVKRRGFEVTAHSMANVSDEIRKETNNRFMEVAKLQLEKLTSTYNIFVVDSLRELVDKEVLIEYTPTLKTVEIYADLEVRYNRALLRKREGDPLTLERFLNLEDRERHLGTNELLKVVDATIINNGKLSYFYKKAIKTTKKLIGELESNV